MRVSLSCIASTTHPKRASVRVSCSFRNASHFHNHASKRNDLYRSLCSEARKSFFTTTTPGDSLPKHVFVIEECGLGQVLSKKIREPAGDDSMAFVLPGVDLKVYEEKEGIPMFTSEEDAFRFLSLYGDNAFMYMPIEVDTAEIFEAIEETKSKAIVVDKVHNLTSLEVFLQALDLEN